MNTTQYVICAYLLVGLGILVYGALSYPAGRAILRKPLYAGVLVFGWFPLFLWCGFEMYREGRARR